MLQRIQSLFFLGIIIAQVVILMNPIWIAHGAVSEWVLNAYAFMEIQNGETIKTDPAWYSSLSIIFTMLLTTVTIFTYQNRVRQMLYSTIISFLILCTAGSYLYFIKIGIQMTDQEGEIQWLIMSMIALSFVLNTLAKIYIRKDEKLVKSIDRLR